MLGSSLISWKNKKQTIVSHSLVEVKNCTRVISTYELVCRKVLFQDLGVSHPQPMQLYYNNLSTLLKIRFYISAQIILKSIVISFKRSYSLKLSLLLMFSPTINSQTSSWKLWVMTSFTPTQQVRHYRPSCANLRVSKFLNSNYVICYNLP